METIYFMNFVMMFMEWDHSLLNLLQGNQENTRKSTAVGNAFYGEESHCTFYCKKCEYENL